MIPLLTTAPAPSPGLDLSRVQENAPGFRRAWDQMVGSALSESSQALNVLALVGVGILVWLLVKGFMDKKPGILSGFKDSSSMIALAAICVAPGFLLPMLISVIDWVVGLIVTLASGALGAT